MEKENSKIIRKYMIPSMLFDIAVINVYKSCKPTKLKKRKQII